MMSWITSQRFWFSWFFWLIRNIFFFSLRVAQLFLLGGKFIIADVNYGYLLFIYRIQMCSFQTPSFRCFCRRLEVARAIYSE
uniref:Uncharacterized protein n=1 Tax=Panstrongylus lignarius TaxID=156445 RepID=A0A224XZK4_9HEMI